MRPIRPNSSLVAAPLVAVVLALVAGCSSDSSSPEAVARQVVQSVLDQDEKALCSLIATNGKVPDEESRDECADSLGKQMIDLDDDERKDMERFLKEGAEKVEEDGDRATVTLQEDDSLNFVKIDDEWFWDPLGGAALD